MDVSVVWRQADDTVELGCRPCSERPEAWLLDVLSGPAGSVAVLDVRVEDGGSQLAWQSLAECAAVGSGTGAADDPLEVLVTIPAAGSVAWEIHGLPGPVAIVGVARAEATSAEEPADAAGRPLQPQARAEGAPPVAVGAAREDVPDGTPADVSAAHDRALRLLWQASSGETPAARVALLAEALRCWPENQSIQRRLAEAKRSTVVAAPPPTSPRASSALTGDIRPVAGRPVRRRRSRGGRHTWNSAGCWIAYIILLLIVVAVLAVIAWREMADVMAPRGARPELPAVAAVADQWAAARGGDRGSRPWCAAGPAW